MVGRPRYATVNSDFDCYNIFQVITARFNEYPRCFATIIATKEVKIFEGLADEKKKKMWPLPCGQPAYRPCSDHVRGISLANRRSDSGDGLNIYNQI